MEVENYGRGGRDFKGDERGGEDGVGWSESQMYCGYEYHESLVEQAEVLLHRMTRAEKAVVLQWVVRAIGEAFPGIENNAGVCGGVPCIVRTRIPVWVLVQARRQRVGEADLLKAYPTLRAEDLTHIWAYARAHADEIDQQIRANEED